MERLAIVIIEVNMLIEFSYILREEYEGDEGQIVPQLTRIDSKRKIINNGFSNYLNGDESFLYFISNLDTIEKIAEIIHKIDCFLTEDNIQYLEISDSYVRLAHITKEVISFNLNKNLSNEFYGPISTIIFLKILIEWGQYIQSGVNEKIVVEF